MTSDPARTFADLCLRVMSCAKENGDTVLAKAMGVEASSAQFLVNVGAIHQRAEGLLGLCETALPEEDLISVKQHIMLLQQSFLPMALRRPWCERPSLKQEESALMALKVLSAYVRGDHPRPDVDVETLGHVQALVTGYRETVEGTEMGEHAHFQRGLCSTLQALENRLGFVFWLGWENTLRPLKELIGGLFVMRYAAGERNAPAQLEQAYASGERMVTDVASAIGMYVEGQGASALLDIRRTLCGILHYAATDARLFTAAGRIRLADAA